MEATEPTTEAQQSEDRMLSLLFQSEDQSEAPEPTAEDEGEDQTDEAPEDALDDETEGEDGADDAEIDGDEVDQEDEDDAEDAGPEQLSDDARVTVKVDGEDVEVTLSDLKRAYSGNAYIQRGMQEAAAKRKEAEAAFQRYQQELSNLNSFVQRVQQTGLVPAPERPDPSLITTDPVGYMEQQAAYEQAKQSYDQQQMEVTRLQQQQAAIQRQAQQAYLQEQQTLLQKAIPELADAKNAEPVRKALLDAGKAFGFSDEELAGVMDHRALVVLNEARKWRELQKSKVAKKAETARPAVKPKRRMPDPPKVQRQKQVERYRRTGDVKDALSLIFKE